MARKSVHEVHIPPAVQSELAARSARWHAQRPPVDVAGQEALYVALFEEIVAGEGPISGKRYRTLMRRYARQGLPWLAKDRLLDAYRQLCAQGVLTHDPDLVVRLQTKPTRSQAGVAVVTVLTKPYPCPGECIFCPTDVRMPKSYLHDEPGAQRAERHAFDPYAQTRSRLTALENLGHPVDKIELLILGGTWSSYRRSYQEWFVRRCFDALNGADAPTLEAAHILNRTADRRCVGLVVETRQDHIDVDELRWLRRLGVTKVQVGIQSMDEQVLALNRRGHDAEATRDAFRLLRLGGFKIHGHWMANLLGATPDSDRADFARLWEDPALRPDELKLYPCMLLENAELHDYWLRGEYQPYEEETLIELLADCKAMVPPYTRLTRVIRDIPTTNVVAGFRRANLRQLAQQRLQQRGGACRCIRCREIRRETVAPEALQLRDRVYETRGTREHFLSYERDDGRLAGFLRLSLPDRSAPHPLPELDDCAMIREIHVYGPVVPLGESSSGEAQHAGLGGALIDAARRRARQAGYGRLAVISAVGTQDYYARHGFVVDGLYMAAPLTD